MFSTSCSFNPFLYTTNRPMMASSFTSAQNPGSVPVLEDHSSSFLQFSSVPIFDVDDDLLISKFLSSHQQQQQQQQQMLGGSNSNPKTILATDQVMNLAASKEVTPMENKKKRSNLCAAKQPIPRRRTGKKDRHSKICTAQGPRDRRMRLSLQIARKFFDLQDMLGFDKASKTIEWLFTKSKDAIKELCDNLPAVVKTSLSGSGHEKSTCSTSESEVVSDSGKKKLTPNPSSARKRMIAAGADSRSSISRRKKSEKMHCRTALKSLDRESRDKARERARERTREKLMKTKCLKQSEQCSPKSPSNLKKLEHFGILENPEKLGPGNHDMNSLLEMGSVSITNKCLEIKGAPRSSSALDFSHNSAVSSGTNLDVDILGFPSNWDLNNARMQHRFSGAVPSMKLPAGNPNESAFIMMTPPNGQEQSLTSIFMNTGSSHSQEEYYHGSSAFMNIPDSNVQNPNCILMTSNGSLIIGNKYDSLFGNA